jgi:tRNA (cytosine38-C5)-methyltransferase
MKKALEFYSGIGGFHYSVLLSEMPVEVVQAFDIHSFANETYYHNFKSKANSRNIETLTAKDIDKYGADVWMMSPPCQPYTRQKEGLCEKDDK